ncbi:MAG: hypothetical protein A2X89_10280 [Deltaproteobacteria bacterium GWD2_55_8]|nr:MAG: hypothetical protein A2X89_10280 [Deltaproteobacteria bacterium GWD2_55_8]
MLKHTFDPAPMDDYRVVLTAIEAVGDAVQKALVARWIIELKPALSGHGLEQVDYLEPFRVSIDASHQQLR